MIQKPTRPDLPTSIRPGRYSIILPPAREDGVEIVSLPAPDIFRPAPVPRSMRVTTPPPRRRTP